LSLTVYIYDAEVADIPDGGDTIPACEQFEEAKHDVLNAGYQDPKVISQRLVRLVPPGDPPLVREAQFEYEREGRSTISYLWLTGVSKNFVKLRFSLDRALSDEVADARKAVLTALGTTLKAQLAPVDPNAKPAGSSISLAMNDNQDDMTTGFTYAIVQTAFLEKSPDAGPVCGGFYVPGFPEELATLRGVIEMQQSGMKSAFAKRLANIDAAGYLEEFVWMDMHREAWGTQPPDGLDLGNYKSWKKKNLRNFKPPALGGISIDHPRPMPIESLEAP